MLLTLHTETVIDACHQLRGYNGNCSRQHGHSWWLHVWIKGDSSQKDEIGILFDFGEIKKIQGKLDHQFINEIPPFDTINATAENLSEWIYEELKKIKPDLQFKIRLYETAVTKKTWCECGDF